jgi:hypothetical protein
MDMLPGKSRKVSAKDLLCAAIVVVTMTGSLIVRELYSRTLGSLLFLALPAGAFLSFFCMPKKDKIAIGDAILEREKTPIGRFFKWLNYILYGSLALVLLYFVGQWLMK